MCIQSTGMQIAQRVKDTTFCKELATPEHKTCEFAVTMINAQEKNDKKTENMIAIEATTKNKVGFDTYA